jgi:enhancing lycopene biosynthesis protein 2
MTKRIGVILSGCGYLDGAEIHESVLTLLALDREGVDTIIMAPDIAQKHVVDHSTGNVDQGERNVSTEAARIARGAIKSISDIKSQDIDALILPGGYGAAKNLSDYAFKGADMNVNSDVAKLITDMNATSKPIGFICISPVICAKVLGSKKPVLTIGKDQDTAINIEKLGAVHKQCNTDDIVIDQNNKIVSTPAYMLGPNIALVDAGITKLVKAVISMI